MTSGTYLREDRPDPAAQLWPAEQTAWAEYRGRKDAPAETRQRWRDAIAAIDEARREHDWPRR